PATARHLGARSFVWTPPDISATIARPRRSRFVRSTTLAPRPRSCEKEPSMAKPAKPEGEVQGSHMTEYLIIAALEILAAIGGLSLFGEQLQELFSGGPPAKSQAAPVKGGLNFQEPPSPK